MRWLRFNPVYIFVLFAIHAPLAGAVGTISSCAVSPDGARAALGLGHKAAIVTVGQGKLDDQPRLSEMIGHEGRVIAAAFSPDGSGLLTGSEDATGRTWSIQGEPKSVLRGHSGPVCSVAYSPDGKTVLTGSADKTVRMWDAAAGREIHCLEGHSGPVRAAVFSPDGKFALTGSDDKTIRLWDAATGKPIRAIEVGAEVLTLAFSPDGRRAAAGMNSDLPCILDLNGGRIAKTLHGHAGPVTSILYSPDGRMIVTGSRDRSVIFWDAAHGTEIYWEPQQGEVVQVAQAMNDIYMAALQGSAEIVRIDPTSKIAPKIRTRAEKWAFVVGATLALILIATAGLVGLGFMIVKFRRQARAAGRRDFTTAQKIAIPAYVLAWTAMLAVPALELGLRVVINTKYKGQLKELPPDSPANPPRDVQFPEMVKLDPDPKIAFVLRPGIHVRFQNVSVKTNEMGYRDEPIEAHKPERTIRVLGLGDSTMFGFGVERGQSYLDLLEAECNELVRPEWKVDFINTAVPGYNTTQQTEILLKKGLALEPDAVIVQFDKNDVQTVLINPKPDFFYSRHMFIFRLPGVFRGDYSDMRAFFLLDQTRYLESPDYPGSGFSAVDVAYREMARVCHERNIPIYGVMAFEDIALMDNKLQPFNQRVADLWSRIGITPIVTQPLAMEYMRDNNKWWNDLTRTLTDPHPNRIGHAIIAQAALPYIQDFLLRRTGLKPAELKQEPALGNIILREISRAGMHAAETSHGDRYNWTAVSATFKFMPGGEQAIVPMTIGHPDVSESNPVKLVVRIEGKNGFREATAVCTKRGDASVNVDIHELTGSPLTMTITVDRTFHTKTDPRNLGVAVHELEFANPAIYANDTGGAR